VYNPEDYVYSSARDYAGVVILLLLDNYSHRKDWCGSDGASVIINWLKHYNLREVQYMASHRYVSSTERCRTDNLEDLQKELEKYYPF